MDKTTPFLKQAVRFDLYYLIATVGKRQAMKVHLKTVLDEVATEDDPIRHLFLNAMNFIFLKQGMKIPGVP